MSVVSIFLLSLWMNFSTRAVTLTSLLRLLNLSGQMTSEMFGKHCTDTVITFEISGFLLTSFVTSSGTVLSPIGLSGRFGHWTSYLRNEAPFHHRSLWARTELLDPRDAMSAGLDSGGQYLQWSLLHRLRIFWTRFCTKSLNCVNSLLIHHHTIWESVQLKTASIFIVQVNASCTAVINFAIVKGAINSSRGIVSPIKTQLLFWKLEGKQNWFQRLSTWCRHLLHTQTR